MFLNFRFLKSSESSGDVFELVELLRCASSENTAPNKKVRSKSEDNRFILEKVKVSSKIVKNEVIETLSYMDGASFVRAVEVICRAKNRYNPLILRYIPLRLSYFLVTLRFQRKPLIIWGLLIEIESKEG